MELDETLETLIKSHVLNVYRNKGYNMMQTARALGIGRTTLYRYLRRYGVKK